MFVRLCDDVVVRKADDGTILLLNPEMNSSLISSPSSAPFLARLGNIPSRLDEVIAGISHDYGISEEDAYHDCMEFYMQLKDSHIIEIADSIASLNRYSLKSLHLEITFACNERCRHCYIPSPTKDQCPQIDKHKVFRLIDEFVEIGGKEITFSGGEPLLHPDFREMTEYASQKGLTVNIFSNLLLCDGETVDFFKQIHIGIIQTSVYSMSEALHDGVTNVRGSLRKTLSAVKHLRKEGFSVAIACPIMRDTEKSAEDVIAFARDEGLPLRLNCQLIAQSNGDRSFVSRNRLDCACKKDFLTRLIGYDSDYVVNNLLEIDPETEKHLFSDPVEFINSDICTAGVDHICVSPTGIYYPCPGWESYSLGSIDDWSLPALWYANPGLRQLRNLNRQSAYPVCLGCKDIGFCKRCIMQSALDGCREGFSENCCREAAVRREVLSKLI